MKMNSHARVFPVAAICLIAAFSLAFVFPVAAQTTSGAGQFRRTVDPSDRSASGTVALQKKGAQQSVQVAIKGLADGAYALFIADFPTITTNVLLSPVSPLNLNNEKKGTWSRSFVATGGAPIEFDVDDLDDIAGGFLAVARPGEMNPLDGITNIIGNVTNVIFGEELPINGETNLVLTVLWAPIPALSANPSAASFSLKRLLLLPDPPLPSPSAKGTISTKFNGSKGQSILDISVTGVTPGQEYSVWIADNSTNVVAFIPAGDMEANKNGSSARFVRDTKFGDPLPQQVRDVTDLSGRIVLIRDSFGDVHLQGTIP